MRDETAVLGELEACGKGRRAEVPSAEEGAPVGAPAAGACAAGACAAGAPAAGACAAGACAAGTPAVCRELAALAERHAARADGFELDEERCRLVEKVVTGEGVSGSVFSLRQRLLRVAGEHVAYVRSEDAAEPLEALVERGLELAGCVDRSLPAPLLAPEDASGGCGHAVGEGHAVCGRAGMDEACDQACDQTGADKACDCALADAGHGRDLADESTRFDQVAACDGEEMEQVARRALDLLRVCAADPVEAQCAVRRYAEGHAVSNSCGLRREGAAGRYQVRLSYIARGVAEMHDVTCRAYAPELAEVDLEALVRRAVLLGEASLDGGALASGTYPVVFSGNVVSQMLMGFWQIFSAHKMATGQSVLAGKLGFRIGSSALTIVDAAEIAGGGPKLAFDVQGAPKSPTVVVDAGVLRCALSDAAGAYALGANASSGNAARRDTLGRIVPNDVTVAPSNIYVQPSDLSLDDLFARMGNGVFLTDIGDIYHSFNFASGDVSAPCRGAFVRNGKLAGGIRSCALSDNLLSLFSHVVAVGSEMAFVDLEDLNAYYAGGPDVLVSQVNLVGGGV